MSDTYYEYTFEFYIGSNLFYKASKLREELKNILKSNHSESITKINQITGEKEEIKLKNDQDPKRPLYSFAIGLIENKKNDENDKDKKINPSKEKRGLVKLTLRTLKELDDSEKNEIKKGMKFKAEINKRKKNNQYQELYKNRLDVIMESSTIKDEVKDRICSIKTSSPFYYDLTKINSNKQKISKKWRRGERVEIELPTKEELEEKGANVELHIHPLAKITTPFDVWQNRNNVRNLDDGTCGKGVGATMKRNEGQYKLFAIDLIAPRQMLLEKLQKIGYYYGFLNESEIDAEVDHYLEVIDKIKWNISDYSFLEKYENLIFEGSQGILLDMDHGIFPNVTYANTTSKNASEICQK